MAVLARAGSLLCVAALIPWGAALTDTHRLTINPDKSQLALAQDFLDREFQQDTAVAQQVLEKEFQSPSTVSHTSWFERLGNAFLSVAVGIFIAIPFAISLLWVNERRNAQLESLITVGQSEVETIEGNTADLSDYDGCLVHMNSETARGMEPLSDKRFPSVRMDSGCIRLSSTVEVYQWQEDVSERKEKDSVGGGETTIKEYSYRKAWSTTAVESAGFHDTGHENFLHVTGLSPGSCDEINATVKYGEHHYLPRDLAMELSKVEDASKFVGQQLAFGSYNFQLDGEYYHCPARSGAPEVGDFRIKFTCVLDHPVSVLALHMKDKLHGGAHTFGPYRSVPRGFFGGVAPSQLKKTLLDAAKKDGDELYEEQKCWDFGPFACLCCCCNLIVLCFTQMNSAGLLYPQVYSAWSGEKSCKECFESEKLASLASKWGLRILGWVILWIGFSMIFEPLEVVLDIIPFLGPYAGTALSWLVGVFTFFLTIILATFIVSLAYLLYHPLVGFMYLALTAGITIGVSYAWQLLTAQS